MNILFLLSFILFAGHGFCDFIPLLQSMKIRSLSFYTWAISLNIYIHLLSPSLSTLLFVIISGIHFSGDFYPKNEIKCPGLGLYIIGIPGLISRYEYLTYLNFLEVEHSSIFLNVIIAGSLLSLIEPIFYLKNDKWLGTIIMYTLLTCVFGVKSILVYMTFYHLPVSILELSKKYNIQMVYNVWMLGTICCGIFLISMFYIESFIEINKYKNIIIGSIFGLLNSHCLTTLVWRNI